MRLGVVKIERRTQATGRAIPNHSQFSVLSLISCEAGLELKTKEGQRTEPRTR